MHIYVLLSLYLFFLLSLFLSLALSLSSIYISDPAKLAALGAVVVKTAKELEEAEAAATVNIN